MVTKIDPTRYRVTSDTRDGGAIDLDDEAVYAPDGHRVTEAETGEFTASRGGRPSLSGESRRSPVLGVRLPPDVLTQVKAAAKEAGVPASEVVRQALSSWLNSPKRRVTARH